MTLPNLIIAGVNKAGTTALFETLAARPDVAGSREKETGYFARVRFGDTPAPLAAYADQFADARGDERVVVESTPSYLYGGFVTAAEIDRTLPDVRILLVLRNPVGRTFSWFRFARSRLMIPADLDFPTYLDRCEELGERAESEEGHVGYRGLSGGVYARYLPAWRKVFADRLRVTWFDDLRGDADRYLSEVGSWLGLDDLPAVDVRSTNRTTDVRNPTAQRAALRVNRAGENLWRRFPRVKSALREAYYRVNAQPEQARLADEDRSRVERWFTPHNEALRAALRDDELAGAPRWVQAT